jgi:hypothetical protein
MPAVGEGQVQVLFLEAKRRALIYMKERDAEREVPGTGLSCNCSSDML